MLTELRIAVRRWAKEHRRRALLRGLLKKNDNHLEDIGMQRLDIEAELGLPDSANVRDYAGRLSAHSLSFDGVR